MTDYDGLVSNGLVSAKNLAVAAMLYAVERRGAPIDLAFVRMMRNYQQLQENLKAVIAGASAAHDREWIEELADMLEEMNAQIELYGETKVSIKKEDGA